LDDWKEGLEASIRVATQKSRLLTEPIGLLRYLEEESPRLLQIEKVNNFIWDNLPQLAKEAAQRKKETHFRGLAFLEQRLSLREKLAEIEQDIREVMRLGQTDEANDAQRREELLSRLKPIKYRITRLKNLNTACLSFFGSDVGIGEADRGENLFRIYKSFRCIGDRSMPIIDVKTYTESIYIPSLGKRVSAFNVYKPKG
jgi:hypothetical protein